MTNPNGGMVRITRHPKEPDWLLLKSRPDMATTMGTFGPAQWADDLKGYVLHADHMTALRAWARYNNVQILNEVRDPREPTKPVECGNVVEWLTRAGVGATERDPDAIPVLCAAPYPADNIPRFCGACGQPSRPVIFEDTEPVTGARCEGCARVVHGGARWCPHCGAAMPPTHHTAPRPVAAAVDRPHLEDPMALGDVVGELAARMGDA